MAELMFPNLAAAIQQGVQFGTQQRQLREGEQRRNQLADLASRAYAAPSQERQGLIQQAVAVDPESGLALGSKLESREVDQRKRAGNVADYLLRAFESNNQAQIQGAYQAVKPYFQQMSPGTAIPDQVDESILPMLHQLKAAAASGTGAPDVKVVGNSLVDSSGNVVYQAPQRFQTDSGLIEVGPQGVRELRLGENVPQGVSLDPSLSPDDRAAILANPQGFASAPDGGHVTATGNRPWTANTPDPYGGNQGGRILPQGALANAQRLQFAADANARAAAADQRAAQAFENQQRGNAPAGFRFRADGSLEPIPGGPKPAGAAATEGERKAATLLSRLEFSERQLQDAVAANPEAASPGIAASIGGAIPFVGDAARNALNSSERQRVEAAQLDILDAALTLGTGAAYTKEQLEGYRKAYFPQIGDSQSTINDKASRLQNVISAARIAAGRAIPQNQTETAAGAPAVGTVEEGYRYIGGDPSNPASWQQVR